MSNNQTSITKFIHPKAFPSLDPCLLSLTKAFWIVAWLAFELGNIRKTPLSILRGRSTLENESQDLCLVSTLSLTQVNLLSLWMPKKALFLGRSISRLVLPDFCLIFFIILKNKLEFHLDFWKNLAPIWTWCFQSYYIYIISRLQWFYDSVIYLSAYLLYRSYTMIRIETHLVVNSNEE